MEKLFDAPLDHRVVRESQGEKHVLVLGHGDPGDLRGVSMKNSAAVIVQSLLILPHEERAGFVSSDKRSYLTAYQDRQNIVVEILLLLGVSDVPELTVDQVGVEINVLDLQVLQLD